MTTIAELINKGYDNITLKGNTKTLTELTATSTDTHRNKVTRQQINLYMQIDAHDQAIKDNYRKEIAEEHEARARNKYNTRLYRQIDEGDFGGNTTPFKVLMDLKMGVWC